MHPIHFCQRNPDCSLRRYVQPQGMKHSCSEPTMASLLPFYRNLFPQLSLEKHAAVGYSSWPMRCKGKSSGGEEGGVMGGVLGKIFVFFLLDKMTAHFAWPLPFCLAHWYKKEMPAALEVVLWL